MLKSGNMFKGGKYMYIEERHKAILEWLKQNGSISTLDIQEKFAVSYESAKRDLVIAMMLLRQIPEAAGG